MLKEQNNKCYICGSSKDLVIDHDHNKGTVRKILCHICNIHLGIYEKSNKEFEKYLENRGKDWKFKKK